MKPRALTLLLLAAANLNGHAAIVFQEGFDAPDGTGIIGRTPTIGQEWGGGANEGSGISGGSFSSVEGSLNTHADFTSALGAGQILTLSFVTLPPESGTFFGPSYAGISLYAGGSERVFVGDRTGSTSWGLSGPIANAITTDSTVATTVTFTYVYDTGAWTFTTGSGIDLSGAERSEVSLSRLRIAHGDGNAIHVDDLLVDIRAIPEPSVALLSSALLVGFSAYRRRR